jgi:hypothetical protein
MAKASSDTVSKTLELQPSVVLKDIQSLPTANGLTTPVTESMKVAFSVDLQ